MPTPHIVAKYRTRFAASISLQLRRNRHATWQHHLRTVGSRRSAVFSHRTTLGARPRQSSATSSQVCVIPAGILSSPTTARASCRVAVHSGAFSTCLSSLIDAPVYTEWGNSIRRTVERRGWPEATLNRGSPNPVVFSPIREELGMSSAAGRGRGASG